MIELYLVKSTEWIELPTESVTWSGKRYQAPRKIEARIFYTKDGGQNFQEVAEGDTVLFKWKKKELFRGTVFKRDLSNKGILTFVAFDLMQYLLANRDVYVFTNRRADQILTRMCRDFEIPTAGIANTSHTLKFLVIENETSLYDIALKALKETQKQTGRRYQIYSQQGKIRLRAWPDPSEIWVLEVGNNVSDYLYSTSIEETATRVKMIVEEENRTKTAVVNDSSSRSKYGVLQYFERVTDQLNQAQLNQRARNILAKKKGVQRNLDLSEVIGIPEVVSGIPVRVKIPGITNRTYYVDVDTHHFIGNQHLMSVQLIENNTSPGVV